MRQHVVMATVMARPGQREAVVQALLAHRARCLAQEPELLAFDILLADADDLKIMLHEVYASGEAFHLHMQSSSMVMLQQEIGQKITELSACGCTPVDIGSFAPSGIIGGGSSQN